jgi:hypothetical protein
VVAHHRKPFIFGPGEHPYRHGGVIATGSFAGKKLGAASGNRLPVLTACQIGGSRTFLIIV